MFCIKSLLFLVFITICAAEAEEDAIQTIAAASTTSLPVGLQLAESKQANENEVTQSTSGKTEKGGLESQVDKTNISSDIEVFEETSGPHKAKQEEEAEEEPVEGQETPPDAEETQNEETEATAEPEPAIEVESEAPLPTEDEAVTATEVETVTEGANNEEAADASNDEKTATGEEKETTQTNDVTNADVEAAGNDEAEMPNDEPAKDDESEQPDLTKDLPTKDMKTKEVSCFSCSSNEDLKCAIKATKEIKCPRTSEGDAGKHNGCYTLYQADTNITMRGCVDDLAEGGLKFCLTNEKLCELCYSNGCNHKRAPSNATKLQLNIYTGLILTISSLILIKYASVKFYTF